MSPLPPSPSIDFENNATQTHTANMEAGAIKLQRLPFQILPLPSLSQCLNYIIPVQSPPFYPCCCFGKGGSRDKGGNFSPTQSVQNCLRSFTISQNVIMGFGASGKFCIGRRRQETAIEFNFLEGKHLSFSHTSPPPPPQKINPSLAVISHMFE